MRIQSKTLGAIVVSAGLGLGLAACGGGGGYGGGGGMASYTVGGAVAGLTGAGLVLQDNGSDNKAVSSPGGSFTFTTPLTYGMPYRVTVLTQPAGQNCTVTNGSGTIGYANVTNVAVNCV